MATLLVLPKLGLTMTEGTLRKWHKAEGDAVQKGDILYSLETDKLTNEIESPADGVLRKIILVEESLAPCLAPVAIIGEAGEDISDLLAQVGDTSAEVSTGRREIAPVSSELRAAPQSERENEGRRVVASPAARKLAKERGIDLALVTGSGPNGRVELKDVELKNMENCETPKTKTTAMAAKMMAESGFSASDVGVTDRRITKADVLKTVGTAAASESKPMSLMRRVIAQRMSDSWRTSPAVTQDISVDMTALSAMRNSLKTENIKASYTDFLVYIVSRTLLSHPYLNCTIEGENIVFRNYVNMGVAVALPDGLLVPVVEDAHLKGIAQISAEIASLAERARSNSLSADALTGGTFTITNLGMYGIESFSPIINQPEAAILGVNAIKDAVVPVNGQFVEKPLLKLSLTFDHRAVDGAVAAQFLADLKKKMENPALLML